MKLFEIETNFEPLTKTLFCFEKFKIISDHFSLGKILNLKEMIKNNKNSRIFKLKSNKGIYIIRSIPVVQKKICEAQCKILSKLKGKYSLLPLKNNNSFVLEFDDKAWMCYSFIFGETYKGDLDILPKICSSVANFFEKLSSNSLMHMKQDLPELVYKPEEYKNLCSILDSSIFFNRSYKFLDKKLFNEFKKQEKLIQIICRNFENFSFNTNIIHYDIQHMNIILNKNNVYFIDLEDIILGDLRMGFSHAIFKCLRHSVYVKKSSVNECRIWLNEFLTNDFDKFAKYYDMDIKLMQQLCYLRTVADIYNIVNRVVLDNKIDYLYDLNKKFANFFEVRTLIMDKT